VSQLDGIGREMPWTMGAFAVASIGLAGLPPINGFESKWFIGAGAAASGQELALVVLLLSGVLNAAYLLPIVHRAFLRPSTQYQGLGEAPALVRVPLMATAAASLVFGVWPNGLLRFYDLARMSADAVFAGVG
jgi:multicomponent Na+:H+ antiporter subunit D